MRHWARLVVVTLLTVIALTAVVTIADWIWYTAPGSQPVAAVIGDPRVQLQAKLPVTPRRVPVYEVGRDITPEQVERVLGGSARVSDGWLQWEGRTALTPEAAMRAINPGVDWRSQGGYLGPASKSASFGLRTAGLSSAFTGTDAASTSFGYYQSNGGSMVYLSIPAHRIHQVGTTKVIPATVALLDVRHHRPWTRVLPDTVPLLPQRLSGAKLSGIPAVTGVWLVLAEDPLNPGRSKPVWVFDPVAEADAQR